MENPNLVSAFHLRIVPTPFTGFHPMEVLLNHEEKATAKITPELTTVCTAQAKIAKDLASQGEQGFPVNLK